MDGEDFDLNISKPWARDPGMYIDELRELMMDRKRQLGDAFRIKEYHDYLMTTGRLSVSLLRYDLTGHDDQVKHSGSTRRSRTCGGSGRSNERTAGFSL